MTIDRDLDKMKDAAKENQKRLETCADHDFQAITPGLFGTKFWCYRCNGQVDGLTAKWYKIGRQHGGCPIHGQQS